MNKYPVYIISKGRSDIAYTANMFINEGIDFLIAVEPQEYELYTNHLPKKNILKLPFSNLGKGSYPARNHCWEHSIKNGHAAHWLFDDNIRGFYRLHKGNRYRLAAKTAFQYSEEFFNRYLNLEILGFNYRYLIAPEEKKPLLINGHVYSGMLIKNEIPYRWRLKYNEDVDLCLQVLTNGGCTVNLNTFLIDKISTASKLRGGNQDELYKGNDPNKKFEKAYTLKRMWPDIAEITKRYNRPHHYVNWGQFKHKLKRDPNIDWQKLEENGNIKLTLKKIIKK